MVSFDGDVVIVGSVCLGSDASVKYPGMKYHSRVPEKDLQTPPSQSNQKNCYFLADNFFLFSAN